MKKTIGFIALLLLCSCSQATDYAKVDETARVYLFGDDESSITFMGMPMKGADASCNPNTNSQAYTFKLIDDVMMIESIRPSGKIMYRVVYVRKMGETITVKAVNGADIPFKLIFKPIDNTTASVSYYNEFTSDFMRCVN